MNLSCSIKEDRRDCPCRLVLDMSRIGEYCPVKVNIMASDGSTYSAVYEGTSDDSGEQSLMNFRIPKGVAIVAVVAGDGGRFHDFSGVKIPLGEECPSVYMHTSAADASREYCREMISLCKDFCRITVQMANDSDVFYPYELQVLGDVDGYSITKNPEEGAFRFDLPSDGSGKFHVNVPRQTGTSLVLRISENDKVLRDFAIGEYMAAAGYDWDAESLEDVELFIDYAKADITFIVKDWEFSFSFDVVI